MKKLFLVNLALLVVVAFLYTSCKKTTPQTLPTPGNNRIMSYTKYTTSPLRYRALNESFTFTYDGEQRLTQIVYTSNDSAAQQIPGNADYLTMNFVYSNNAIYKTTLFTGQPENVYEQDTFILNSGGQVWQAFTPGNIHTFNYFNNLISSDAWSVYDASNGIDTSTTISATSTYTSDNGDLLNKSYNGNLSVHFPDSGYAAPNPYLPPHDTVLTPPLTITWTTYGYPAATTVTHTINGYNDSYSGNTTGYPVTVEAEDAYGVIAYDTVVTWPGYLYPKESYFVYPQQVNRPGDYFQIESFTTYGQNIYLDAHLIKQIIDQDGPITNVVYTIDADSRILQTYVTKTGYGIADTVVYKFQYQTF